MGKKKVRKVRAVGAAGVSGVTGGTSSTSRAVEAAMSQAVTDALKDGVSVANRDEIRKRMMAARAKVLEKER